MKSTVSTDSTVLESAEIPPASGSTPAEFINERRYLKGVTAKTLDWYAHSFKAFDGCSTEAQYKTLIREMRDRGVSPVSVNTYTRCINAYLAWSGQSYKLPKLKEESKIIATLTTAQLKAIQSFKPKSRNLTRCYIASLIVLDTGLRLAEVLGLQFDNVDFDNMVLKVRGKGNKHRLVPMTQQLIRAIYRYVVKHSGPGKLLFTTRNGGPVGIRNFQRDFAAMGEKLGMYGVRFSPHTLRHTFAIYYLRNGGDTFKLSKILGHSSITTTMRYLQSISIDDLKQGHGKLSPLNN